MTRRVSLMDAILHGFWQGVTCWLVFTIVWFIASNVASTRLT